MLVTADYADITDNQIAVAASLSRGECYVRTATEHRGYNQENTVMSYLRLFIPLICIFTIVQSSPAQEPKPDKPKQFIYVLRLVPRLHSDAAWTNEDKMALDRHFARFKHAIETGELILAGRTLEPGDKTFGIAVFEATDEAAARAFMQSDPAVVAGLMTAELHPFAVALQRKTN